MNGCSPLQTNPVQDAMMRRRSVRAFLDRPVSTETIERILTLAARAPSGSNCQPWSVDVLTGDSLRALSTRILSARQTELEPASEYQYYPPEWCEPFLSRRRQTGWALYNLIGVQKGDTAAARAYHDRNFNFFGAPVGMIVSLDRRLGDGAFIDTGFFMQGIAMAAVAEGLGTCMQAAFAPYHQIIRDELRLDAGFKIVCGISIGYEDPEATINSLRTERTPVSSFSRFHG